MLEEGMQGTHLLKLGLIGMVLVSVGLEFGCRSRKRSEKVGSAALKVLITLKNIEDVAKDKIADFNYRIRCSGGDWSPGTLTSADAQEVEFFVKGVQLGDTCGVQVLHPNPPTEYNFTEETGVMFGTPDNIEISSRVEGQLWAEALLSKYYTLKSANLSGAVRVPVVFKDVKDGDFDGLIAELKCSPEFEVLALGLQNLNKSTKRGEFVFESGLTPGVEFTCTRIQVRKEKMVTYFGDMSAKLVKPTQGAFEVNAVELNIVDVNNVQGVVIVTTPGDACKDNEVFDIKTRTCKPQ
jgi:hypothetical protein